MTSDPGHRGTAATAELRTAAALRWQRPLLTAELAGHACARAVADGDVRRWLQAAGWLVDGHAAGSDARAVATAVLRGVTGSGGDELVAGPTDAPGAGALELPEAARLRVGLAAVAQSDGEIAAARALVDGLPDTGPGEDDRALRLDRLAVEVRCALLEPSGTRPAELRAEVERCGEELGGEAAAFADLLCGSVHRADRDHDAAVDCALRGLRRLGWTPDRPGDRPLSSHLAAALLSQWVTALAEAGPVPGDVLRAAAAHRDAADAGRHGVLLRLVLARAGAGPADDAARALDGAAVGAEAADVPALVASCRTAQAELHEGAGRYREALESIRASLEAERADRERGRRFREALAALALDTGRPAVPAAGSGASDRAEPTAAGGGSSAGPGQELGRGPGTAGGSAAVGDGGLPTRASAVGRNGSAPEMPPVPSRRNGHPAAAPDGPHHRNGSAPDRAVTDVEDGPGEPAGPAIDPADPLGLGPIVGPDGDDVPEPDDDGDPAPGGSVPVADAGDPAGGHLLEWADRTWYGPGSRSGADAPDTGAPLADALVAELRGAGRGGRRPRPGPAGPASASGAPSERPAADPGEPAGATPAGPAVDTPPVTGPSVTGLSVSGLSVSGPSVSGSSESRPSVSGPSVSGSSLPGSSLPGPSRTETSGGAASVPDREIVIDVVDDGREAVAVGTGAAALEEVAVRARRLVPPSGRADVDGEVVRIALPDADRVTALLWARSLATHLADRVRRGGLPDGAALRLRVAGPDGPEGDEVVRPLTGPDEPAPDTSVAKEGGRADAAGRADDAAALRAGAVPAGAGAAENGAARNGAGVAGEDGPEPTPSAGPAMADPLGSATPAPENRPARTGRRAARDGDGRSPAASGITVRPGSGGRRRADGERPAPRPPGTPDDPQPDGPGGPAAAPSGPDDRPGGPDAPGAGRERRDAAREDAREPDVAGVGARPHDAADPSRETVRPRPAGRGHPLAGPPPAPDTGGSVRRGPSAAPATPPDDPAEIPADMGLAELLAGAMAAYREI